MLQSRLHWTAAPLALALCIAAAGTVRGQQPLELDAERLLTDEMVLRASVSDGVWEIAEDPDRQLILLPLRVDSVEEPTELDRPDISISGARFVAWYLPDPQQTLGGQQSRSRSRSSSPSRPGPSGPDQRGIAQQYQEQMMREMQTRGLGQQPGGRPQTPNRRGSNRSAGELDASPPRLTRDATLLPDGQVRWELTRGLYGGEVVADTSKAYALLIDRSILARPERPGAERQAPRTARDPRNSIRDPRNRSRGSRGARSPRGARRSGPGSNPRSANRPDPAQIQRQREEQRQQQQQRQAAMADYNEEMRAYRQTLQEVSDLPDEFTDSTPPVIWAIYSAPTRMSRITLEGDDPLPWSVSFEQFEDLRSLAEGNANAQRLTQSLRELLEENHPFSHRVAAIVLAADSNLQNVSAASDLAPLLDRLFDQGNTEIRSTLIEALTRDPSQTPLAAGLLDRAMDDPDPSVSLPALRGNIELAAQAGRVNSQQIGRVASTVTSLLASEDGPPADETLGVPLDLAEREPDTVDPLAGGIDLTRTAPARREEAIRFVIDHARYENPLALRWIADQLISSSDDAVQRQTLALLAESPEDTRLPLTSNDHPLLTLLGASDAETRELAWAALPRFEVDTSTRRRSPRGESFEEMDARDVILQAALTADPTPRGAVAFLVDQRDRRFRSEAIERILMEGRGPGRRDAAFALAEEDTDRFVGVLGAMSADERQAVGRACYEYSDESQNRSLPATAVVGLLRRHPEGDGFSGRGRAAQQQEMMRRQYEEQMRRQQSGQARPGPNRGGPPSGPVGPTPPGPPQPGQQEAEESAGSETVVPWFAEQIASGDLPHPREWSAAFGGEEALLAGVLDEDQEFGRACAAALLADVVWPRDDLVIDLRQAAFESAGQAEGQTEQLARVWREQRAELADQTLADAGGRYTVSVHWERPESASSSQRRSPNPGPPSIGGTYQNRARGMARQQAEYEQQAQYEAMMRQQAQGRPGGGRRTAGTPSEDAEEPAVPRAPVDLGEIDLTVSGGEATTAGPNVTINVVEDPPMLALPMPSQLQKLAAEDADAPEFPWPLAQLELRPAHGGGWTGRVEPRDGEGTIHVTFNRPASN